MEMVTVCVICWARPYRIPSIPSVTTNDGIANPTVTRPFTSPTPMPNATAMREATVYGYFEPAVVGCELTVCTPVLGGAWRLDVLRPLHAGDDDVLVEVRLAAVDRALDHPVSKHDDAVRCLEQLPQVGGRPEDGGAGPGHL